MNHDPTERSSPDEPSGGAPVSDGRSDLSADPDGPAGLGSQPTVISSKPLSEAAVTIHPLTVRELGRQLVGKRLAHFELVDFVGGGGMGAVFRATDTLLNRTVAVKVLSRDQAQDEETVKRFRNEAQSAARLDHENIARVYFVGEDDGWYFIVFEFIEGQNLRDLVAEQGPLPLEQALSITVQVAAALDHAAQREVVHRDIKPSNVLLTSGGRAKLVDMGLARLQPMHTDQNDLTASGVTLGTFDYISPEQARDPRTADARSDIYSLGCTLYFMLTGRPPFADGTVLQKLLSHSSDPPPDPRTLRPDLPDGLLPVLDKMLAKSPADRYAQPGELMGDLLLLAERLGLPPVIRAEPIWMPAELSEPRGFVRHLPWLVPSGLLVALALLWDPLWSRSHSDSTIEPRFVVPRPTPQAPVTPGPGGAEPATVAAATVAPPAVAEVPASPTPSTPSMPTAAQTPAALPPGSGNATASGEALQPASSAGPRTAEPTPAAEPTRVTGGNGAAGAAGAAESSDSQSASASGRRILVASEPIDAAASGGHLTARDLTSALQMALEDPGIETIELRQNGRLALSPISLDLAQRGLTLVAAPGYSPILSFRTALSVTDPASQGMLRVRGGRLTLEGLHLEMTVPTDTLEGEWSLLQVEKAQLVRLRNCTITVSNSYGGRFSNLDHVSVLHVLRPLRDDLLDPPSRGARLLTEIDLTNCVIRGETIVLRAKEATPLRFKWHNGLLVTTERLISLGGAREPPARGERIMLDLEHLTAVMDQGLGEFSSLSTAPHPMEISIWCTNSILVTQRWAPLISQSSAQSAAAQKAQLEYFGEHNFYEGMETFWKITPANAAAGESLDFERWRAHWTGENRPSWQRVKWLNPPDRNRPAHEHQPADYALDPQGNPAIKSSSDRLDAGFRSGLLPQPLEPDTELPRKTRPLFQY